MFMRTLIAALLFAPPSGSPEHGRSSPVPAGHEVALAFDGIDDFATVPACDALRYPGTGGWTVELWVKPIAYPLHQETSIIGQESVGVAGRDPWSIRAHPTHFEFRVDGPKGDTGRVRFDLALGVWQHVACVYRGPGSDQPMTMAVYIDGRLIAQTPVSVRMEARDDPVYFAALSGTFFRGLIDETRVWAHALDSDDVIAAMHGDINADDARLRAWWSFNEDGNAVAMDRSGSQAHAVLGRPHDPADTARPARIARITSLKDG